MIVQFKTIGAQKRLYRTAYVLYIWCNSHMVVPACVFVCMCGWKKKKNGDKKFLYCFVIFVVCKVCCRFNKMMWCAWCTMSIHSWQWFARWIKLTSTPFWIFDFNVQYTCNFFLNSGGGGIPVMPFVTVLNYTENGFFEGQSILFYLFRRTVVIMWHYLEHKFSYGLCTCKYLSN